MTEMEVLRKLVSVGAAACNVEEKRAIALLERLTGTTKPSANKELFYKLVGILKQSDKLEFTTKRAAKLRMRLKIHSESDMITVAQAIASDAYMMGENGRRYGTIDYLIRADEQIDTWLETARMKHQKTTAASVPYQQPKAIQQAAEVKRADPAAVAEAKRKLYEKMGRK